MRKPLAAALLVTIVVLQSGCLTTVTLVPGEVPPSDPLPSAPPPTDAPLGPVNVFVIEAQVNVTSIEASAAPLGVAPIDLPHCSLVYLVENHTKLLVGSSFNRNATDVILIRYTDRHSFSHGGDDVAVYALENSGPITIPAALNRTTPLYEFSPRAGQPFRALLGEGSGGGSLNASYDVDGRLTLFPDIYPEQAGSFRTMETHALRLTAVAQLDFSGPEVCW